MRRYEKDSSRTEYLLVDGYNIIFAWEGLKAAKKIISIAVDEDGALAHARTALVDVLSDFQGSTGIAVIIVFDAHRVKNGIESVERQGNVSVVFTREAETADAYIERTALKLTKQATVRVATSDFLEQIIIMSHGARRISAAGLLDEVIATKQVLREKYIENRPIKQNLLFDNLDEETARILERMRRGK